MHRAVHGQDQEEPMKNDRQLLRWMGVLLGTLVVLTGCPYEQLLGNLNRKDFVSITRSSYHGM